MPTGVPNNTVILDVGKQTAKGTVQATPTYEFRYTGGFGPAVDITTVDLAETDSTSLATGQVRTGFSMAGTQEGYVRPDEFGLLAYATMGANADSGVGPNYTHTATHSVNPPYFTTYRAVNTSTLVDRFTDCRVTSLSVTGGANAAITYSLGWGGLAWTGGVTKPVISPVSTTPLVYPQVTCTIDAVAPGTVQSFTLNVANNANFYWGDSGVAAVDYIMGRKVVTGSLTLLFSSDADYRTWLTGTTSGTALSTTVATHTLDILCQVNTNLSVDFNLQNVRYNTYTPNFGTDGGPITAAIDFSAQNLGTVAQYLSIVTKNQVASY